MSNRDFCMARIAVALSTAQGLSDDLHTALSHFADPEEDLEGEERDKTLELCELGCHGALTAIQQARRALEDFSPAEFAQAEEDIEEEEDDEEEDDDGDGEPVEEEAA